MNERVDESSSASGTDASSSPSPPLFELGDVHATRGAIAALIADLLERHVRGEWGTLDPEDVEMNRLSITHGMRILSAYYLPTTSVKVWVITEADRSMTTVLLPEEY